MTDRTRKPYLTDLSDEQWAILEPMIPLAQPGGRPRAVDRREVINTILYLNRTGCQWDLLPHDLLPKSTVYEYWLLLGSGVVEVVMSYSPIFALLSSSKPLFFKGLKNELRTLEDVEA